MVGQHVVDERAAEVGEFDEHAASVVWVGVAGNEVAGDEPVDDWSWRARKVTIEASTSSPAVSRPARRRVANTSNSYNCTP